MGKDDKKAVKSKIEQIRNDLEKKLAAIEKSKDGVIEETRIEVNKKELKDKIDELNALEENPDFEVSDAIVPLEFKKEVIIEKVDRSVISIDSTHKIKQEKVDHFKKIKDDLVLMTNFIEKEVKEPKPTKNEDTKDGLVIMNNFIKKEDVEKVKEPKPTKNEDTKIIIPPKTIISTLTNTKVPKDTTHQVEIKEKKSRKGFLSYLLIALLILLFFTIGYLAYDYTNQKGNLEAEKMNQIISEYKNKSYLDSIELLDANKQLDFQSEKLIDSLDKAYEKKLLAISKVKDKNLKENLDFSANSESYEVVYNEKINITPVKGNENYDSNLDSTKKSKNEFDTNVKDKNEDEIFIVNDDDSPLEDDNLEKDNFTKKTNTPNDFLNKDSNNSFEEIPSKKITALPIFPGCEKKKSKVAIGNCTHKKIHGFVNSRFNTSLAQNIGLKDGVNEIRVQFMVDGNGYATVLHIRAKVKNDELESEAVRVIESLPRMKAGTIDGKFASQKFTIPIKFLVNND